MQFELCLQCYVVHQPGRGYHYLFNCLSGEGHFGDKKLFHLRNIKEKSAENYSVAEESTQSTPGSYGDGEINILSIYLLMPLYISVVGIKSLLCSQHYRQVVGAMLHLHVPLIKLCCKWH